jgi:hypothetical protein
MTGCAAAPGRLLPSETNYSKCQTLPVVVVVVRDLLTLFEHVIFGLVVGNLSRY